MSATLRFRRRHLLRGAAAAAVGGTISSARAAGAPPPTAAAGTSPPVRHRRVRIGKLEIFYREAGPEDGPAVLLLHGFPSSSFMFRELMPQLADRYRVVAPDYPGFGQSSFPDRRTFRYSFATLARVMDEFVTALRLERHALYVQDYGAPIGFRLALRAPERVSALVVQNGNAYAEGLSQAWDPLKTYWQAPTRRNRETLRSWLTEEGTRLQYVAGVPETLVERFSPDTWTLDWARLQRPGNIDMQLDLFGDYRNNVDLYPEIQRYFRARLPPMLVVWGKYDPFFTVAGAAAYRRDLPDVETELYDSGHFALETHASEIGCRMRDFLGRRLAVGT